MGKVNRPSGVAAFEDLFSHAIDYVLLHHSVLNHEFGRLPCIINEVEGDAFCGEFYLPLDELLGSLGHMVPDVQDHDRPDLARVLTCGLDVHVGVVLTGIADQDELCLRE